MDFICALNYSLHILPKRCPEYEIFNLANKNSVIINLNHDELAKKFINKQIVLIHLHGLVSTKFSEFLRENLYWIIDDFDFNPNFFNNHCISTREDERLLITDSYLDFDNILIRNGFNNLVIIGYSFFSKGYYEIYDEITYYRIKEFLIKNKKCRLFIIDLNPSNITNLFIKYNNCNARCHFVNWPAFTHSIDFLFKNSFSEMFKINYTNSLSFFELYKWWVNSGADLKSKTIPQQLITKKSLCFYSSTRANLK